MHRKMNDYISDVYESHINHFTSNSMSSLQNSATTTTIVCAPSLTVPTKTNMNPQCVTSNNSIPVTSNLPVKNSDASSQTLPEIIDLDGLPASLSTSFSTTVVVTTSEMYANTPHDNHLTENDNTNNNNNNNNSNNDCRSNHNNDSDSSNTVETEPNEMKISEDDSGNSTTVSQPQQQQQQQQQHHSRQRRMPALKHLQLPSTCSSTLLRQTSIPKGYFLSTPEVINELGRLHFIAGFFSLI
ncbi:unnamed protein product [Trichobilharzia regenti]|nr:unnamed protein product [Trichobilharzia regenti]